MIIFIKIVLISILIHAPLAYAVDTTVPHTFTAGSPALASQVNDNFQALANAINAINARLDGTNCSTSITQNLDFGILSFTTGIGGGVNFLHTETDLTNGDVCIKTDGSVKIADTSHHYTEVNGPSSDINQLIDTYDAETGNDPQDELEYLTGNYSLTNSCELQLNLDGESIMIQMNPSLTMGIGGARGKDELCSDGSDCASGSGPDVGDSYFSEIIVFVRKGPGATFCSTQ